MADDSGAAEPSKLMNMLDTIYQEAFAYQSTKIIKIQDSRLTSTSFNYSNTLFCFEMFFILEPFV